MSDGDDLSERHEATLKPLAFLIGLFIAAIGVIAMIVPESLDWIAHHFVSPGPFYVIGAVRVAIGLVMISAASASRAPRAIRVLGFIIVIAGLVSALTGLLAMDRARTMIDWWLRQGPGVTRLTGVPILALGSFIAFACAPAPRAGDPRSHTKEGER